MRWLRKALLMNKDIHINVSKEGLEQLRKEIMAKFEGKDVSLIQLLLEYGCNEMIDVSVGEPDSPFDYGKWKDQLKKFRDAGASDIILVEVSEGGYDDVVSLQTSTIRITVCDQTTKLLTELMMVIEDIKPDSVDYRNGYIEAFFG